MGSDALRRQVKISGVQDKLRPTAPNHLMKIQLADMSTPVVATAGVARNLGGRSVAGRGPGDSFISTLDQMNIDLRQGSE